MHKNETLTHISNNIWRLDYGYTGYPSLDIFILTYVCSFVKYKIPLIIKKAQPVALNQMIIGVLGSVTLFLTYLVAKIISLGRRRKREGKKRP